MRALIVGCGYIGLPLGIELVRQGHEVFGLRRSADGRDRLKSVGIQPLMADITRPEDLVQLPEPLDWVVNCVASGGGDADDYRRVYLNGMRNLLDRLQDVPLKKFVYTSSTSVYGQIDGVTVDETSPAEPTAETARILVETEKALLDASQAGGLPGVIVRLAGIYGPDRTHRLRQFLNQEARLDGSGRRLLNLIHRTDVVGCVSAALERGRPGEIYNAVDDEPVTEFDFFEWLARTTGQPLPPEAPEGLRNGKRGITSKRVLNQKLKGELGYRFKYPSFRDGFSMELQRLQGRREEPGTGQS
jgi:nucleoside-diphosphate-sugar epimerase